MALLILSTVCALAILFVFVQRVVLLHKETKRAWEYFDRFWRRPEATDDLHLLSLSRAAEPPARNLYEY
jgi:hypothetical protein